MVPPAFPQFSRHAGNSKSLSTDNAPIQSLEIVFVRSFFRVQARADAWRSIMAPHRNIFRQCLFAKGLPHQELVPACPRIRISAPRSLLVVDANPRGTKRCRFLDRPLRKLATVMTHSDARRRRAICIAVLFIRTAVKKAIYWIFSVSYYQ